MRDLFRLLALPMPIWAPEGADAGAAGDPPPGNAAPPAGNAAPPAAAGDPPLADGKPAGKWFEGDHLTPDELRFLESKGLTGIDDPREAAAKLTRYYRGAEQLIGDKNALRGPGKDQTISDWMKANAKVFGIPEDVAGYKVDKPADWPKDMPWNDDLDARAQAFAHQMGVPADIHKGYVGMMADYMKGTNEQIEAEMQKASAEMMAELQKDWGQQTAARITQAKQAAQHFAQEAGLSPDAMAGLMSVMKEKVGDAATMRLFQAIGAAMGEDTAVQIGKGGSLGITPAEAQAQMNAMAQPGGKLWEANMSGNRQAIAVAQAERERLARIVAGG